MTKKEVKAVIERVLNWPEDRQASLVRFVELMEEQDDSDLRLSDDQAAEVRRRIAEKNPHAMSLAKFNDRTRRRFGV
jgi:hypothetical protein